MPKTLEPKEIINDEAYKYNPGPILLLAGPGTGKTFQLAKRIQYLTEEKEVSPDEITVITFTTEAARSMRSKIEKEGGEYIKPEKRPSRISTMHSLGYRIIKENIELTDLKPNFKVVESLEIKKILMRDAALLLGFNDTDAELAFEERASANPSPAENSKLILNKYEEILRACNTIDYDDQIVLACKLLKENEAIRNKYAEENKHLLVDEYQDINPAQFELINLLAQIHRDGLFVVGDDDQSIYSFRGGSPRFIRNFGEHFGPNCTIIKMQTSHRCLINIIDSAVCVVVEHDKERIAKKEYNHIKEESGKVILHNCPSDDREAEIIASIVKKEGAARTSFILVPNKYYAEKIKSALRKFRIGFNTRFELEKTGWNKFLKIKDWIINHESNLTTRLCIELIIESGITSLPGPRCRSEDKIKERTAGLLKIANLWNAILKEKSSLWDTLCKESNSEILCKQISEKLIELKRLYEENDVANFLQKTSYYAKPWASPEKFFEELERLSISSFDGADNKISDVRILTIQGVKGLEAELVFIVGLEEGNMPRLDEKDLPEIARLLFVAMTRAKEELHLFCCRKRSTAVTFLEQSHNLSQSRFLNCLPEDKIELQYHQPKKIRK